MTDAFRPRSYTLIRDYENCQRKAHRRHWVRDLPKEESPELEWGNAVHTCMEQRLIHGTELPPLMAPFEVFVQGVVEQGMPFMPELQIGITASGEVCDFFDNKQAWLRGKVDVPIVDNSQAPKAAILLDWKTGKRREDVEELRVHSLLAKARWPTLERVHGRFVWLKEMAVGTLHDLSDFVASWSWLQEVDRRIRRSEETGHWPPTQNPLCAYCTVADCEFNRRGK